MKLSVAMAYHNRRGQFIQTLLSMNAQTFKDFEVVIVDDNSREDERIEDLPKAFSFPIKVIRMTEKIGVNPCVAYNLAFKNCSGEKIIIQNPECIHVGEVLKSAYDGVTDDNYYSFACYSLDLEDSITACQLLGSPDKTFAETPKLVAEFVERVHASNKPKWEMGRYTAWFNHSVHRPCHYHFCTAISKNNLLERLNGFDERFAFASSFDDDELICRIKRLGLNIVPCDFPFVIHLAHEVTPATTTHQSNAELFNSVKASSHTRAN